VATWLNDNYLIDIKESFRKSPGLSEYPFFLDYDPMEREAREVENSESYVKRRLNPSMTFENS